MITVLIPFNEINETNLKYLEGAYKSVIEQKDYTIEKILLVVPENIITEDFKNNLKSLEKITLCPNTSESTTFQGQVNFGVSKVTTKYFSILEFDDEYSRIYFRNVDKYVKYYKDSIDTYIPIVVELDDKVKTTKLVNDHAWSKNNSITTKVGYLNIDSLLEYSVVNLTGSVFNTEKFVEVGGLKKNIELTFNYEYLLRAINSGHKVLVLPIAGYKHIINRTDSLFSKYLVEFDLKKIKFWFETATKEYHFNSDRVIIETTE